MQTVFEKIIEKLEENQTIVFNLGGGKPKQSIDLERAIEIVKQAVAEYNNGWIPASEPPKTDKYVLLSFENYNIPLVGRYDAYYNGGAYYIGDCDGEDTCVAYGLFVDAWQPLPPKYQTKGE